MCECAHVVPGLSVRLFEVEGVKEKRQEKNKMWMSCTILHKKTRAVVVFSASQ